MMMKALPQTLAPSKTKFCKLKEWTIKMKYWKMKSYLLSKKYIAYKILPPSTTMMGNPISALWYVATLLLDPMPSTISQRPMSTS